MVNSLVSENIWLDRGIYDEAERVYYEGKAKPISGNKKDPESYPLTVLQGKVVRLEQSVVDLHHAFSKVVARLKQLEWTSNQYVAAQAEAKAAAASNAEEIKEKKDDDDVDLFGSESEDEAADEIRQKRLAEYESKKAKKPVLIAKSNIILDIKPWDDETDMKLMETAVRSIELEGLVWGASKLVPLAYGIHKLQISCVVEDDLVSVDLLQEKIEALEFFVQSVDIAAFNKV